VIFTAGAEGIRQLPQTILLLILLGLPLLILADRQFGVVIINISLLIEDERSCLLGAVVEDLLVLLDLVLDVIADLQLVLEIEQVAALVEEEQEGVFESLLVAGRGGDVDAALGEDGVLRIHQLVEQNSQRVGVVLGILAPRLLLELPVVEVGDVGLLLQGLLDDLVDRHDLTDLGDAVLDVDVLDVEEVEGDHGGGVDELERLDQTEEDELDVVLLELDVGGLEPLDVALHVAVIGVFADGDEAGALFVVL
jgi:hypothetical protein